MKLFTTVIVDDEKCACDRLEKLLTPFTQLKVLACLTSSVKALDYILKNKPDLIFLDIELENNVSAFDLICQLKTKSYRPGIILVTAYPQYSIKAIKHEVFDYILKPVDIDELKLTLKRFMEHYEIDASQVSQEFSMLSKREYEILKYVLNGKSSREIAEALFLSINTVHTHRRNILKKTGCKTTLDLLRINHLCADEKVVN